MHWGIRRYQNSDGSLTPAGKKRYGIEDGKVKYKIKAQSPFEKQKAKLTEKEQRMTEKEEIERRKNELNERLKNLKNLGKSKETLQKQRKPDTDKKRNPKDMSDDELRNFINRYNLEQQYNKIINSNETKSGSKVVKDILAKSATTVATKYVTKAMESAVEEILKKNRRRGNGTGSSGGSSGSGGSS